MSEQPQKGAALIKGMELEGRVVTGRDLQEIAIKTVDSWEWDSPPALFLWLDNTHVMLLVIEFNEDSEIKIKPQDWLPALADSGVVQNLLEPDNLDIEGVCLYSEAWVRGVVPEEHSEDENQEVGDELRVLNTMTRDFVSMSTFTRRTGEWTRHDTRGGGAVTDALSSFYARMREF